MNIAAELRKDSVQQTVFVEMSKEHKQRKRKRDFIMELVAVPHSSIQSQMETLLCSPNSWTWVNNALNIFKKKIMRVKRRLVSFDTGNSMASQGYSPPTGR